MAFTIRKLFTTSQSDILDIFADRTGICIVPDRLSHPRSEHVVTLDIPGYVQVESYTCGFVAGLMVLHTFRPKASIDRFYYAVRPTSRHGASTRKIANALRSSGVGISIRNDLDFAGIREQSDSGFPIISCGHTDDPAIDHWVVIYGYGIKPNRIFTAANGLPFLARREYSFAEYSNLASPRRFGLVCSGKWIGISDEKACTTKPKSAPSSRILVRCRALIMKRKSKTFIVESHIMKDFSKAIEKVNRRCGLDLDLRVLHAWKEQIRNFEMVVMGMYNAGKSTLLNLLLDLDLENGLPTGIRPTTNKLWKIRYTSRPQLKAMRFDSSEPQFVIVKELSSILEDLESKYSANEIASIDYYELGLPSEWLRRTGWAIWDTPGKDDLDGLLNEDHFGRVLESAEGAVVVTNYDQYKSCSEYLLQLKSKQIECVVIALTNSAARTPDEFTAAADRHLEQVTGYLRGFFPSARFDFAIDSKDPSGSVDRMQNRWLKSLWKVAESIEEIEEALIMQKAWRSLEPVVSAATDKLELHLSKLRGELSDMKRQVQTLEAKMELPISYDDLEVLDRKMGSDLDGRIRAKAENLRSKASEAIQSAKEANEPSAAEIGYRILTFGWGGRSESEINLDFANDLYARLQKLATRFIEDSVWQYLIPKVEKWVVDTASLAAGKYLEIMQTKHWDSHEMQLRNCPIGPIYDYVWREFERLNLAKMIWKPDLRNNEASQDSLLNQIQKVAEAIFHETIRHLVQTMSAEVRAHHGRLRMRVCKSLRNTIAKQTMVIAETEESISKIADEMNILNQLKSQLKSALDRHQQTINKQHHS